MKLPRWLVIATLTTSVLLPLAAAGWWWVTWPERTAREFVNRMAVQEWDQANELVEGWGGRKVILMWQYICDRNWGRLDVEAHSRGLGDVTLGRQSFTAGITGIEFVVVRGKVVSTLGKTLGFEE